MAKDKDNYGAGSLTVLEGLDAVRKRPGMYIGTTDSQGLMHCLWEIIDNSVDEALAGVCNHIVVTLHSDGSVEVADNGRGIPVDIEPKTKLTGVEVVLTKLHAGAKFGNSSYGASGGLHGVGSSVVNALSSRLDVEVDRDGKTHHMSFHQGHPGVYTDVDPEHPSPDAPFRRTRKNRPTELEIIGKVSPKTTGTRIRYWADPEIFNDTAEFSYEQLIDRVRQTSFLVPGLKITVIDENIPETGDESVDEMLEVDDIANAAGDEPQEIAESDESEHDAAEHEEAAEQIEETDVAAQPQGSKYTHARIEEFCHTGGVRDFVDYLSKGEAVSDIWRVTGEDTYVEETQAVGDGGELHAQKVTRKCAVDIAMRWTNGYDTTMRSFVNVVETPGGGTHVDGFLLGMTKQIRKAIEDNARKLKVNLKDSNMKVERDDILAGLVAVITVRIAEPQFQGQTKDVLGTAQVKPIVSKMTDKQFGEMIGDMAHDMHVAGWYAPAMNIHRSAFSGRTFEYFSEDSLLSGAMASNEIAGAKSKGVYSFMKHFALNDQETNRTNMVCTWANEQSIRETYLKPFEMSVKEGGAQAVMSSFNYIGYTYAGASSNLLQTVLRGEWGFKGFVLTDYFGGYGYQNADQEVRAGNDSMLATTKITNHITDKSATSVKAMRQAAHNVLYTAANSWQYANGEPKVATPIWKTAMYVAWGVTAVLVIGLEIVAIKRYLNRKKAVATVESAAEPVAAGPANAE